MRTCTNDRLVLMRKFAERLKQSEMRGIECCKYLKMSQQNFMTFITSMTEFYLVYEYNIGRDVYYGLLK